MPRLLGTLLFAGVAAAALQQPQYVCLNKMYGCTTQDGCWNENNPTLISQDSIDLFFAAVGGQRGSAKRALCLGWQLNALDGAPAATKLEALDAALALALANELPILLTIDAFEFWGGAPQLWNFFDSSAPGYNPDNVLNVEWSAPSPLNATMIAWANWGAQFRKAPHPNLMSPAFRAAAAAAVQPFAARVAAWLAGTLAPAGKTHLLAGVKCSWEAWIGTNFFYYPSGNSRVGQPASSDPTAGVAASTQLGYAALCAGGAPDCPAAGAVTQAQLDGVLNDYLEFAAGNIAAAGLPRHKILTHEGTYFGAAPTPSVIFNSPAPAVTTRAKAGWSLYANAYDPRSATGLAQALDLIDGAPWGAVEWRYMGGNAGSPLDQWLQAFNNTLSLRNNRLVDVYNVENLPAEALQAAQQVLAADPGCLVDSAAGLASVRLNATHVRLSWTPGADADLATVQASLLADTLPSGALAAPDVADAQLPGDAAELVVAVAAGAGAPPVYWTVLSRGCGGAQLAVAAVQALPPAAAPLDAADASFDRPQYI